MSTLTTFNPAAMRKTILDNMARIIDESHEVTDGETWVLAVVAHPTEHLSRVAGGGYNLAGHVSSRSFRPLRFRSRGFALRFKNTTSAELTPIRLAEARLRALRECRQMLRRLDGAL